ncbi:MAG: polyisoprenoid-binding protein [Chlorobiaceae bacterium]|nr:polyisoprenoid-binding protein [Chlorobiaceae bacterium]NTW73935.1 polyisoprenoid-binding protein [Chlorobiaceae bacterium]
MKKLIINLMVALSTMVSPALVAASTWSIDASHSTVAFKIRHLMVSNVTGGFNKYTGVVEIDDRDVTKSKVNVTIDANSINTNEPKRDEHLRSADFFDTARYPTITFASKRWAVGTNGAMKVTGNLTMHGVTREVALNVEPFSNEVRDPWGHIRRGTSASAVINRQDFGINWNKSLDAGGVTVGDEVNVMLEIEMIRNLPGK